MVAQRTLQYKVPARKRSNFAPIATGQQYLIAPDESQARVVLDAWRIVYNTIHHRDASTFFAIQNACAPAYNSTPAVALSAYCWCRRPHDAPGVCAATRARPRARTRSYGTVTWHREAARRHKLSRGGSARVRPARAPC